MGVNRNAPFTVKAVYPDGHEQPFEAKPGDPIWSILKTPGHRKFRPDGDDTVYVKVTDAE